MFDSFSSFIKFWSSERNTENRTSDYILTKKGIILRKVFQFLSKRVVKRAMRKKLNAFTLQLVIYYILEWEISIGANADIAKTKQKK